MRQMGLMAREEVSALKRVGRGLQFQAGADYGAFLGADFNHGLVGAAVERGEFRPCDPTTAALALLGAVEMTVRARLIEGRFPALADSDDGVLAFVLDGLRAG